MPVPLSYRGSGTILLVNHHALEPGGAETYLLCLAEGLSGMGERVVVTWNRNRTVPEGPYGRPLANVEWIRQDYHGERDIRRRLLLSLSRSGPRRDMARLCGEISPGIVHVNQIYEGDGIDLIRGALGYGRAPVFGTIHLRADPPTANRMLQKGKTILLKSCFRRFPYRKIFPSSIQRDGFARIYGDDGCLHVVPNGIRMLPVPSEEETLRRKEALGLKEKIVVAYAGRIAWEKGADILTEAFLRARTSIPQLFLLVVGEGPARGWMEARLREADGRRNWMVTGWIPSVRDYLCAADLVLLPTRFDIMSYSVVEALSLGIPCLVTKYEGLDEIVMRGAKVEVADRVDADSFAESLARILPRIDSCRERARANLETVRRNFDLREMAETTARLYFGGRS